MHTTLCVLRKPSTTQDNLLAIYIKYSTVLSTIWPILSAFLLFCRLNDTQWENSVIQYNLLNSIQGMAPSLLLTFFICLHNQLSSIHSIIKDRCFKNVIHQIDSKKEWLLLSPTFKAKLGLVFVLTLENGFSLRFHTKANRKSIDSSKKRY